MSTFKVDEAEKLAKKLDDLTAGYNPYADCIRRACAHIRKLETVVSHAIDELQYQGHEAAAKRFEQTLAKLKESKP